MVTLAVALVGIAIDRASKGLDALEIRAPHDGILVYKRDWRGDITRVGLQKLP